MSLAQLSVSCSGAAWSVRASSATWQWNSDSRAFELLTASIVGPETATKSIRALLVDPQAKPVFNLRWTETDEDNGKERPRSCTLAKTKRGKTAVGYNTKFAKLCRGGYHLVCVSKLGGIILDVSEDRLWEVLTGEQFTTPLLRSWMPSIMKQLREHSLLELSQGFNGSVGVLDLETETLDKLVSQLVSKNVLKLTA